MGVSVLPQAFFLIWQRTFFHEKSAFQQKALTLQKDDIITLGGERIERRMVGTPFQKRGEDFMRYILSIIIFVIITLVVFTIIAQ